MNQLIIIILAHICSFFADKNEIHIYCYSSCPSGGTTIELLSILTNQQKFNISMEDSSLNLLDGLLSSSKKKRHYQQKISGIDVAFSYDDSSGNSHYMLIVHRNKIVDLTSRKEYIIKDKESLDVFISILTFPEHCHE